VVWEAGPTAPATRRWLTLWWCAPPAAAAAAVQGLLQTAACPGWRGASAVLWGPPEALVRAGRPAKLPVDLLLLLLLVGWGQALRVHVLIILIHEI
jgi:hypothetical protein